LAAMLLVFVSPLVPPKNSRSLATGAVPPQLVALFQLLFVPAPVHVRLAAGALVPSSAVSVTMNSAVSLFTELFGVRTAKCCRVELGSGGSRHLGRPVRSRRT